MPQSYDGREQAWIKHQLLASYLQRLLMIIGMGGRRSGEIEICYVDCFAGPWGDDSDDLEGTSIAISLRTMAECRRVLQDHLARRTAPFRQALDVHGPAAMAPQELLQALFAIERAHGRDRDIEQRWGPRTLDLDLLLYGEDVLDVDGLTVPHPRIAERAFVLVPLVEIAPDAVIPGHGTAREVLAALESFTCEALG